MQRSLIGSQSAAKIQVELSKAGSACVEVCSGAVDSTPSIGCSRVTSSPKVVSMGKLHVLQVSKQGGRGWVGQC